MEGPNPRISEFLKEQYEKELDRKNDYTGRITLLSGILAILGGGLLAMARELAVPEHSNEWIEGIAVAASLICIGIPGWWVWSAFTNITYLGIPSSADLLAFRDGLVNYYQQVGSPDGETPQSIADAELLTGIDKAYSMLTTENYRINERRSRSLKRANMYFLMSISIATLALGLQLYRNAVSPKPAQEVKIMNIRDLLMTQQAAGQSSQGAPSAPSKDSTAKQALPTQAPKKPEFPPPRLIREDFLPGKQTR
jgi:hypothetical protein